MPTLKVIVSILNLGVIAASLVVFFLMLARGGLRERALALGPTRDMGLGREAYAVGLALSLGYVMLHLSLGWSKSSGAGMLLLFVPFILIALLINRAMHTEGGLRKIGLVPRRPGRDGLWALAATFVGLGLAGAVGMVMVGISELMGMPVDNVVHETLKKLLDDFTTQRLVGVIISAVILAPLIEELVFRGVLQTSLVQLMNGRRWVPLLIASALFSVMHCWAVDWQGLAQLFVIGLVFGYVYERTGSLLCAVLTHAGFNALNIAIAMATME